MIRMRVPNCILPNLLGVPVHVLVTRNIKLSLQEIYAFRNPDVMKTSFPKIQAINSNSEERGRKWL